MNECRFELVPLYCIDCGAATAELGTCDDHVWCRVCSSRHAKYISDFDTIYQPPEEGEVKYQRVCVNRVKPREKGESNDQAQ